MSELETAENEGGGENKETDKMTGGKQGKERQRRGGVKCIEIERGQRT